MDIYVSSSNQFKLHNNTKLWNHQNWIKNQTSAKNIIGHSYIDQRNNELITLMQPGKIWCFDDENSEPKNQIDAKHQKSYIFDIVVVAAMDGM